MKLYSRAGLLLLAPAILLFIAPSPAQTSRTARVSRVIDAETLEIRQGRLRRRVRLFGVKKPADRREAARTRAELNRLVRGRSVRLVFRSGNAALIYVSSGRRNVNVNETLLSRGRVSVRAEGGRRNRSIIRRLKLIESKARVAKRGLWKKETPSPGSKDRKVNPVKLVESMRPVPSRALARFQKIRIRLKKPFQLFQIRPTIIPDKEDSDGFGRKPESLPAPDFPRGGLTTTDLGCKVVGVDVKYKDAAGNIETVDAPLLFPFAHSPPVPGSVPNNLTGPIFGTLRVAGRAPLIVGGTGFEFRAHLNGRHGCFSQQFVTSIMFFVHRATNTIVAFGPDEDSRGRPRLPGLLIDRWYHDGINYAGNTRTGIRRLNIPGIASNEPVYEGTPKKIHWVDTPGYVRLEAGAPRPGFAMVKMSILKSIVWNSGGTGGGLCTSVSAMVFDMATKRHMPPAAAAALLTGLVPGAGAGIPAALAPRIPALAGKANTIGGGLSENPDFSDDCIKF